jgi:hypothetical protein
VAQTIQTQVSKCKKIKYNKEKETEIRRVEV